MEYSEMCGGQRKEHKHQHLADPWTNAYPTPHVRSSSIGSGVQPECTCIVFLLLE